MLGVGELYRSYLRRIYERVKSDTPQTEPTLAVSFASKVLNDAAGLHRLPPTLLVFEIVPYLPINPCELPKQVERTMAI